MSDIKVEEVVKQLMMKMSDEEKVETLHFAINKESEKRDKAMQDRIEDFAHMTNTRLSGLEFMIGACLLKYGEDDTVTMAMFVDMTMTVLSIIKDIKLSSEKALWGDK